MGLNGAWQCRSVVRTDVGLVRKNNEDSLVDRPSAGVWAVADGMGGHERGEVASGMVREALTTLEPNGDVQDTLGRVEKRLGIVHRELRTRFAKSVCGSTVVVLVAAGGRYACMWIGDARLYRWRAGRLERLTRDHSLVEELVASGTLSPEAAHKHPLANRITRAVGVGDKLQPDTLDGPLGAGERFLLCSDGLHGVIDDGRIADLLSMSDLDAAADALMSAAFDSGAPDNIAVVLVAVERSG